VNTADHLVFDHAGHFAGPAALDPQTGLVVTDRHNGRAPSLVSARVAATPSNIGSWTPVVAQTSSQIQA
jgi:hypothetical protein